MIPVLIGLIALVVLFMATDWWEILALLAVIGFVAYMAPSILKEMS